MKSIIRRINFVIKIILINMNEYEKFVKLTAGYHVWNYKDKNMGQP